MRIEENVIFLKEEEFMMLSPDDQLALLSMTVKGRNIIENMKKIVINVVIKRDNSYDSFVGYKSIGQVNDEMYFVATKGNDNTPLKNEEVLKNLPNGAINLLFSSKLVSLIKEVDRDMTMQKKTERIDKNLKKDINNKKEDSLNQ